MAIVLISGPECVSMSVGLAVKVSRTGLRVPMSLVHVLIEEVCSQYCIVLAPYHRYG